MRVLLVMEYIGRIRELRLPWFKRRRCEMCLAYPITNVHVVRSSSTGKVMQVGPTCAGLMCEEDKRVHRFGIPRRGNAGRFMAHDWNISRKGREWIKAVCCDRYFTIIIIKTYMAGKGKDMYAPLIIEESEDGVEIDRFFPRYENGKIIRWDEAWEAKGTSFHRIRNKVFYANEE